VWIGLSIFAIIFGTATIYCLLFTGKIYPRISIAGVVVQGHSTEDVAALLSSSIKVPQKIHLVGAGQNFDIDTKDFGLSYDYAGSARRAFNLTRTGNFLHDLTERIGVLFQPVNLSLTVNLNEDKLDKIISVISGQISQDPVEPSIKLVNQNIVIDKGLAGTEVDTKALKTLINNNLSFIKNEEIQIPINIIDYSLKPNEVEDLKKRADKYIGKSLQLKFEDQMFALTDSDLLKLIDLRAGFSDQAINSVTSDISGKVNREPQNPKFIFDNGRVTEFQPALDGIRIDSENFKNQIINSLFQIENGTDKVVSFDIPVLKTSPEITTDKVNNLGIKELIGRGVSLYHHSIPSRIHNVVLAASRINGTLVKPGDTFSFNNTLGDISQFTGYQQAYIISGGKTILGDGGGVCQVSTTLFRAILKAGLPVVERAAHAYRVGYYEQDSLPGFDATVYGPSPDLKFTNDTPGYILIEATANPKNYSLVFELYGTSDGRIATTTKPVVSNVTPALPTVYQDDPTLPAGTVKQTDFSAAGATVKFNYTVVRSGEIIFQKTFISNYRPWAAVYLRGTGPAI